jgi:hypothetical protein
MPDSLEEQLPEGEKYFGFVNVKYIVIIYCRIQIFVMLIQQYKFYFIVRRSERWYFLLGLLTNKKII